MKNLFLAAIAALAFYGCAGITNGANIAESDVSNIDVPEDGWTRYLGTDGVVREVAFLTAFFSRDFRVQPADGEAAGFALTKKEGGRLPFRLGAVYKSGDRAFMLKDADTEAEFDLKDEASATELWDARRIKFYEFSSNLTTVAVFEAPISVCEAFQKGDNVSVKSVSSYYDAQNLEKRHFTAVITQAKISSKSGALLLKSQIKNFTNLNGPREVTEKTPKFEEKIQNELRGYEPTLNQICAFSAKEREQKMKNRMIFKAVAAAVAALAFSGCAGITGDVSGERTWRTYMENDASIRQIGFITETTVYEMNGGKTEEKFGDYMGRAEMKAPGESDSASQNLGWVYSSGDGVKTLIVIDLDSGKNVDLSDKDDIKKLQNSKKFKFYEFGGGILESVIYSAQKSPVCKAFFSGEPINARSVTNYYVGAFDEFFATVIDAKIVGNKGFEIKNLDFKFNLPSSKLAEAKEQATSEKFRQDVIEQDVKKQGRILLNILCYYSMPSK